MGSPVFGLLAAAPNVTAIIGSPPNMRCFAAGNIPQTPVVDAALPCVTQQTIGGSPENYLAAAPTLDHMLVQVNVWALTLTAAYALMVAVRIALESGGANVMVNAPQDLFEFETGRFGYLLEFHFWVSR